MKYDVTGFQWVSPQNMVNSRISLGDCGGIFRLVDDDDDDDDEEHYIAMLSQPPRTSSIDVLVSLSFFLKSLPTLGPSPVEPQRSRKRLGCTVW